MPELDAVIDGIQWLVERFTISATPEPWALAAAVLLLIPATVHPTPWRTLRHAVTIVHEMGHVLMGWLWGRRIHGIRLHTDTSGLTISAGKPRGLGVLMTYLAGYTAPPLAGLALVWLGLNGWSGAALTAIMVTLVAAFLLVRNVWGLVTIVICLALAGAVFINADPTTTATTVSGAGIFLLLAGARGGVDLWLIHDHGQGEDSDASQAARHSLIPTMVWVWAFTVTGAACAFFGGGMIVTALT